MSKELIKQLKNLKHNEVSPRPEWLKSNRAVLLSQINNTVPAEKESLMENVWLGMSILLPKKFVFGFVRPIAVLLVVALVGTSGWIATVDASYESVPGDLLYPAKRMLERTQITAASVIGARHTTTKLHSEFAKRRAAEINNVIKSGEKMDSIKVSSAVSDLKSELKNVSDNLEKVKSDPGSGNLAKEMQKNNEKIKNSLNEAKKSLSSDSSVEVLTISKDITEAKDLTVNASVQVLELLVKKHQDGEVSKEDISMVIDQTMENAVADMEAKKQKIQTVKSVVDAMMDVKEVVGVDEEGVSKIDNITIKTNEAVEQVNVAANQVADKVIEIKNMVENGELAEAITMVKSATETTRNAEKIQDDSLIAVQKVVPMPLIKEVGSMIDEATMNSSATGTVVRVIMTTTTPTGEVGKLPITITVTTTPATTTLSSSGNISVTNTSTLGSASSTVTTTKR